MNDLEKLRALLTELGVKFTETKHVDGRYIRCTEGDEKVTGYGGFYTSFRFQHDGKFISMGAWE